MTDGSSEGLLGLLLRLRAVGVDDQNLFAALEKAPHDRFVPVSHFEQAWSEATMPLSCGQTMPAPDITARLVAALDLQPSHAVLEVGTGSGFQTALLSQLSKKVRTVDRYSSLLETARQKHQSLGLTNVTYAQMDGRPEKLAGAQDLYDRIICDMAFDSLPRGWLDHLASGGVVVCALGSKGTEQTVVRLTKIGSRFERENLFPVRFGVLDEGVAQAL